MKITFLKNSKMTNKELWYMSLNMPKGIAVASVTFTIALQNINGIQTLVNLIMAGTILSLIISTIVTRLSSKFLEFNSNKIEPKIEKIN